VANAHATERGLVCPSCQSPLAGTEVALSTEERDTNVRLGQPGGSDIWRGRLVILALGSLVALGVLFVGLVYFLMPNQSGQTFVYLLLAFAFLEVVTIAALVYPVLRWWLSNSSFGADAKILGTGVLLIVTAVGVVAVFIAACDRMLASKSVP
jgi:hypothetical protein